MRKILLLATLFIGVLSAQAQEKVMSIQNTDGTATRLRVADLKKISFLTVAEGGEGLLVKTKGGATTAILFEAHPVVTVSDDGKLKVKSDTADDVVFEISDIAELAFGEATGVLPVVESSGFSCVLQDGGVMLRGIPDGVLLRVYSLDGRSLPTPSIRGGEVLLSRATLGTGVFIVKVGPFSAKIQL